MNSTTQISDKIKAGWRVVLASLLVACLLILSWGWIDCQRGNSMCKTVANILTPIPTHIPPTLSAIEAPGKIVFAKDYDGIYTMNANGSNQKIIFENFGAKNPAWSPDGKKIAFEVSNDGTDVAGNICVMNADGSNQVKLTNTDLDFNLAWSPDGKKIAFESARDKTKDGWVVEIYVMNADGSNQIRLTQNSTNDTATSPTWSPDSKKIAFASHQVHTRKGEDNHYIINADGSNPINITNTNTILGIYSNDPNNSPSIREPAWSPDGRKIAFVAAGIKNGSWMMDPT